MNALEAINVAIEYLSERGQVPYEIIMHPTWTTRGYVFVVNYWDKRYIVVNRRDFDAAAMWLSMLDNGEDLVDYCYGVPLIEDPVKFQAVRGGVYEWTLQLESVSPQNKTIGRIFTD